MSERRSGSGHSTHVIRQVAHRPPSSELPHTKQYAFGPGTIGAGPSSFGAGSGSGGGVVGGRVGGASAGPEGPSGAAGAVETGVAAAGPVDESSGVSGVGGVVFGVDDGGRGPVPTGFAPAFGAELPAATGFLTGTGSSFFLRRKNDIRPDDDESRLKSVGRGEVTVFRDARYRGPWRPLPANG